MKKIVLIVIICLSVFLNFYLIISYFRLRDEISLKDDFIDKITTKFLVLEPQIKMNLVNLGYSINSKIIVSDAWGEKCNLSQLLKKNRMTLVFRYTDACCSQCIDYALSILNGLDSTLNLNNILFLSYADSNRIFKMRIKDYDLKKYNVYNCESLDIPAEQVNYPYFMIVDSLLNVRFVYFPNKSSQFTDIDSVNVRLLYNITN